jgi:hypothetical protein
VLAEARQLYPGHDTDSLRIAAHAVHALLLSDATRSGPAGSDYSKLLVRMALHNVQYLAEAKE